MRLRAPAETLPVRPNAAGEAYAKPAAFPLNVCALEISRNAHRALLRGRRLPLPPPLVRRIVVIGDTGCRIKAGDNAAQACRSPTDYPFAAIAAAAARLRPDLVVHVGDYLYRETPCPLGVDGCAASPWGYGLDAWRADFLEPARPLLRAAPLVLARGNHESCMRAGQGWWRLLDPHPFVKGRDCVDPSNDAAGDHSPAYAAPLGGGDQLIVFDSAVAPAKDGLEPGSPLFEAFKRDRDAIETLSRAAPRTILVDHHPMLGFGATLGKHGGPPTLFGGNLALQTAFRDGGRPLLPDAVTVSLAGHVHVFEQVSFAKDFPTQFVAGFSGTQEDVAPLNADLVKDHAPIPGAEVASFSSLIGVFGFLTFDRVGDGVWSVAVRDQDGKVLRRCSVEGRRSTCAPASPPAR
jgi:hypothetical protein